MKQRLNPYRIRSDSGFRHRAGSVLLVILVIVVLLSLGAYTYTETMLVDYEAALAQGRQVETAAFAESGVEIICSALANRAFDATDNLYHDPDTFHGISMRDGETPREIGHVSVIVPYENDPKQQTIRFGLTNESSKLNVNTLFELDFTEDASGSDSSDIIDATTISLSDPLQAILLQIPGMTEEIADAILDYIDEDTEIRPYGAESEYYEALASPYPAKNGPLATFEELLQIRGVTPEMLFGEDANRNGLLDANENDGDASAPFDNADGILDPGWSAFMTVFSRENNLRADGSARIHLNQDLLTDLFDELEPEFGEPGAQFIVAYRIYGAAGAEQQGAAAQLTQTQQQGVQMLAGAITGGAEGEVTRAGLDLSKGSAYTIKSLFDLVDIEITAQIDGSETTLVSPWSVANMAETFPLAFDALSTVDAEYIDGRIDVNQARVEVLMTIPDMDPTVAEAIAGSSAIGPDGEPLPEMVAVRSTPSWLVTEGLVDLESMRLLAPYITTRGDVFRAQIVGYFEQGGPSTRLEVVIDATESPARATFVRDLSMLGKGYTDQHLQPYRFVAE